MANPKSTRPRWSAGPEPRSGRWSAGAAASVKAAASSSKIPVRAASRIVRARAVNSRAAAGKIKTANLC